MAASTSNAALIIVDVQDGLDDPVWGRRNNPEAENNMARLLDAWRARRQPIYHVQHISTDPKSPLRPNQPGNAIKQLVMPNADEPVIQKTVNSAFIGTDLEDRLRKQNIQSVVIVGLTTNHCVETTARMAGNLGFTTFVVADATATFDRTGYDGSYYPAELVHSVSLASLHDEFATILNTADLLKT